MNKLKIWSALCFLLLLTCKKPPTLPPQTAQGSNNFGCYVNGVLFTPLNSSTSNALTNDPALRITYGELIAVGNGADNEGEHYIFSVGASRKENGIKKTVGFGALNIKNLKAGNSFTINNSKGNFSASYQEQKGDNFIHTYHAYEGTITILKVTDTFIAGTFWFNAKDSQQDTVKVTEGRFDVAFPRNIDY